MGLNIIYQDTDFIVYDPETYDDLSSIFDLSQSIWESWKTLYTYVYVIVNNKNGSAYLYVPDNDTFKYKENPKDGVLSVDLIEDASLNQFQHDNPDVGLFIETLTYDILKTIFDICAVKRERLTTEKKTYVMLTYNDKNYMYTANSKRMNPSMVNAFKENLEICSQVTEYIHDDVLNQIYS